MLAVGKDGFEGETCLVSGSGNVASYAVEKINELGGKVVTMSDSAGYIYDQAGIDADKLAWVVDLKTVKRGRIEEYAKEFGAEYHAGERPWTVPCDLAFPCATQNEVSLDDTKLLLKNGCIGMSEGANMPTDQDGIHAFVEAGILFAPVEGGQRRGRGGLGSGDESELRPHYLERGRAAEAPARHHAGHSRRVRGVRQRERAHQLRQGRQRRRLRQGGRRHALLRRGVSGGYRVAGAAGANIAPAAARASP